MTRYAVMGEAVQDHYHDLRLIGPTQEAETPEEAARQAIEASPHSSESLVDFELLVFEISEEPATIVEAQNL